MNNWFNVCGAVSLALLPVDVDAVSVGEFNVVLGKKNL